MKDAFSFFLYNNTEKDIISGNLDKAYIMILEQITLFKSYLNEF